MPRNFARAFSMVGGSGEGTAPSGAGWSLYDWPTQRGDERIVEVNHATGLEPLAVAVAHVVGIEQELSGDDFVELRHVRS